MVFKPFLGDAKMKKLYSMQIYIGFISLIFLILLFNGRTNPYSPFIYSLILFGILSIWNFFVEMRSESK